MKTSKLLTSLAVASIVLIAGCSKDNDPNLSLGMPSGKSSAANKPAPVPVTVTKGAVNLGVAGDFVILSQAATTDVSPSVITGNIGASPITGAAIGVTCSEVTGIIYEVDAAGPSCAVTNATKLGTAVINFGTAYTDASGRAYKADANHLNLGGGDLGGLTLAPGVYHWDNNVTISTNVTLKGTKNDVWIFQVPGTLDISSATSVILQGGAMAKNIFG